ncbi:MAG TPA: prolyl oligopeptidase family serine peptidase [Acidimicrobiales bacterium]|jgi:dipeptidyl aminopeptidase/acylaminoacyl peptidase|nr:prolyl oligopeptidase family serine peptidase [Acidimicrobiales bacterium]
MCGRGRVLAEPRLSPDGQWLAVVATDRGRGAVVVLPAAGGPEVVVTTDPPPPPTGSYGGGIFDWTPDSEALVYAAADHGLYLQRRAGGPPRPLVADGQASSPAVSPDGTQVAFVRDGRHVAVASLLDGGPWPFRLSESPDFALDPAWSPDGATVAWVEWDVPAMPWDASRIMVAPADAAAPARAVPVPHPEAVSVSQPRFSPDGSALAFLCDATGSLNLWRADADGGNAAPLVEEPFEHGEGSWGPGARTYAWSPDGRQLVFGRNEAGFGRLCVAGTGPGGAVTVQELDRGVYQGLCWAGGTVAGVRSGARTPDQVVVLAMAPAPPAVPRPEPAAAMAPTPPAAPPPEPAAADPPPARRTVARGPVAGFEAAGLVEPEPVSWESEAVPGVGSTVYGRLYRARAGADTPLLVWIHGGPTGQHRVTFDARLAYFCDRGFNVLHVDYRGSSGWGRAYAQALRGEWGRLDVADSAAGMRAATLNGWGHPDRMVPIGASSGGLTVLSLLARHPELCAAGVDLYGVTDLFDLDETTHRFEAHYLSSIVGPLPDAADRYRDRSPTTFASRIRSPLLVLQGSADVVVPQAQSDALVAAVRAAGGTVEYHVYDGEGHGWNRAETVEAELETTWAFLRRHVLRRR